MFTADSDNKTQLLERSVCRNRTPRRKTRQQANLQQADTQAQHNNSQSTQSAPSASRFTLGSKRFPHVQSSRVATAGQLGGNSCAVSAKLIGELARSTPCLLTARFQAGNPKKS
jgi:hypothetical protein